jgi:hypothetical protein
MALLTITILALTTCQPLYAAEPGGESMLDYFKSRLPAQLPRAATDTIPIKQGNAMRMINPDDLGIVGPTGPKGDTGQGFHFRGEWSADADYQPYDVVTFGGSAYCYRCQ